MSSLEEQVRNINPLVGPQSIILASAEAEELEAKQALLMPKHTYICRKTIEYAAIFEKAEAEIRKKIERGNAILLEKMQELSIEEQNRWRETLQNACKRSLSLTDVDIRIEDKCAMFLDCSSFQDVFRFSEEDMEWFYQIGHSLFEQGNSIDAGCVFCTLQHINPHESTYWTAWALTEQAQGNLEGALLLLASAAIIAPNNPRIRLCSANIYLELKQVEDAKLELQALFLLLEKMPDSANKEQLLSFGKTLEEQANQMNLPKATGG